MMFQDADDLKKGTYRTLCMWDDRDVVSTPDSQTWQYVAEKASFSRKCSGVEIPDPISKNVSCSSTSTTEM